MTVRFLHGNTGFSTNIVEAPPYYQKKRDPTLSLSQTSGWERELLADPKVGVEAPPESYIHIPILPQGLTGRLRALPFLESLGSLRPVRKPSHVHSG